MMTRIVAGIDVHKRVLMVVLLREMATGEAPARVERRRFGTTTKELLHLAAWLQQHGVTEAVMESTAQYWKPVWYILEPHLRLYLAQAWSNRAPRGKKTDFKDAERLVRRHLAGELTMSFVPDAEQRRMRSLTRRRAQLTRDRVRVHNQVESLLEETRIKLSCVVTDLFGVSGQRILYALSRGESDPEKLAQLADERVKRTREELAEALQGAVSDVHRLLLRQHLKQLELIDQQSEELLDWMAECLRPYSETITRLAQVPGIRMLAAQQIVAEAGIQAGAFGTAGQFSSWIGLTPGRNESAEHNYSSSCAKGNRFLRRVLCQAAQAAVRTNESFFQRKFRRLLPRLGFPKAIWAIARHLSVVVWKILHEGATYIEYGALTTPQAMKRRLQRLKKEMRALGFYIELKPIQLGGPPA
jgi:transposase